jgi:hypothetical protein
LAGCSTAQLEKINKDLSSVNAALAGKSSGSAAAAPNTSTVAPPPITALATPPATEGKSTQLIIPTDKAVAQAVDEALPTVKKILAIHRCVIDYQSLRLLNPFAVPGKVFGADIIADQMTYGRVVGVSPGKSWKYHQKSTCPSIRAIDNWKMPALNALTFRVSFLADDSGEADIRYYSLLKSPSGAWELADINNSGF